MSPKTNGFTMIVKYHPALRITYMYIWFISKLCSYTTRGGVSDVLPYEKVLGGGGGSGNILAMLKGAKKGVWGISHAVV